MAWPITWKPRGQGTTALARKKIEDAEAITGKLFAYVPGVGTLETTLGLSTKRPVPLVFKHKAFWGGEWVDSIDLAVRMEESNV